MIELIASVLIVVSLGVLSYSIRKRRLRNPIKVLELKPFDGIIEVSDDTTITIQLPPHDLTSADRRKLKGLKALQRRRQEIKARMKNPERPSIFPFYIQKACGCVYTLNFPEDFPGNDIVCVHGGSYIRFVPIPAESGRSDVDDFIA